MNIQEINEVLDEIIFQLNENSAKISQMEVHNDDAKNQYGVVTNKKFPHFHWLVNNKIHFKFGDRCPKTKAELKKLIAFPEEKNILKGKDYKDILADLRTVITYEGKEDTVYEHLKAKWRILNKPRDIEEKDLVSL